jgi:hypothetical protein
MASGTLTIRVRPLRVGFLVDPADHVGLYQAIEMSTFLWGGNYNPIIPAYRRTPTKWDSHRVRRQPLPSDIIDGYLNGFDPDLVVPVGICANRTFKIGNRELVKPNELIGDLKDSASPRYGVGFIELLNDFVDKELKYKRNDELKVVFPELPRAYRLFLASVYGAIPKKSQQIVDKHFIDHPSIMKVHTTLKKYAEHLRIHSIFPRRLTSWALDERPLGEAILLICNATSSQDIIDYWNLRAAGYYVLPIPIQASHIEDVKKLARDFIEENYRPHRHDPNWFYKTTIQKSRTLREDAVKKFCQSLNIPNAESNTEAKYVMQLWYPRLWDSWARENSFEGVLFPFSHEQERRIAENENRIEMRSEDPKFEIYNFSGKPKFANEFNFSFYGTNDPMAEVFPEGGHELASAIGTVGYEQWRFSKSGPVFLSDHPKGLVFMELPLAEAVMMAWFRERGWKVSLSGPGRIAKQLLKQLGGTHGTVWLAHKGIIELLGKLEKESGMSHEAVIGELKQIIAYDKLFFNADRFLEGLLETNALRLGAKIQCPICTRYNWYQLDSLSYKLHCRFCLSDFSPPTKSPKDMKWSYMTHGPYSSSNSQGAFTVLLTLKFLSGNRDHSVTPLLNYKAENGIKNLEADLTCLYKSSRWHNTQSYVVHAECKSFNRFESRDINRMKELAKAFPGSVLIFATLKDKLLPSEIKMIRALANTERKNKFRGKPNNPVVILTSTELCSSMGLMNCWKGKGGLYDQLSQRSFEYSKLTALADATQQLYLDLPSWFKWSEEEWKKRKQKKQ